MAPESNLAEGELVVVAVCVVGALLAVLARIHTCRTRASDGVDHHYWIQVADAYRQQRRLPIDLNDRFLLEDRYQYYPPGFALILSLLPRKFLDSAASVITVQAVDLLLVISLGSFAVRQGWGLTAVVIIGAVVLSSPALVVYNTQLASRSVGNLFLTTATLALLICLDLSGPMRMLWWSIAGFAAACVLLTHKMSTQLLSMVLLAIAIVNRELPELLLVVSIVPSALLVAVLIVGRQFLLMQFRAHADVVAFWYRNWRNLGANQLAGSPIYGEPNHSDTNRYHKRGTKGIYEHLVRLIGFLPAGPLVMISPLIISSSNVQILAWLTATYVAALVTTFVRPLKCLGGGHLYVFGSVAPCALILGGLSTQNSPASVVLVSSSIAVNLAALMLTSFRNSNPKRSNSKPSVEVLCRALEQSEAKRALILPCVYSEEVSRVVGCGVLWGGHSLGFRELEPFWPVLQQRVSYFVVEYDIDSVVLEKRSCRNFIHPVAAELSGFKESDLGDWVVFTKDK